MDESLVEGVTDAWEAALDEIASAEAWALDPAERVTRAAVAARFDRLGGVLLTALRDLLSCADLRLREVREEVRDACEDVLGSEGPRVGIRERYAVALDLLRAARIDEDDIILVARQADPRGALARIKKR